MSNRPDPHELPAGRVVHARLADQVARVRRLDPLVRAGEPGAVHDMRVALRRLRSALTTYRPLLDRDVTEPLRAELRWLADQLGAPRDAEVTRARLTEATDTPGAEALRGTVLTRLDAELRERTDTAHEAAVTAMRSDRHRALLDALSRLAAAPPLTDRAAAPAGDVLPRRVRREWKRVRRRVSAIDGVHDPRERAALLHEVRKAAKRLRYAVEPLEGLYGRDARRLVRGARRVQSALGEHHDAVVAQAYLLEAADRAAADGEDTFGYGALYAVEGAAAARAEARFRRRWRPLSREKPRRRLS